MNEKEGSHISIDSWNWDLRQIPFPHTNPTGQSHTNFWPRTSPSLEYSERISLLSEVLLSAPITKHSISVLLRASPLFVLLQFVTYRGKTRRRINLWHFHNYLPQPAKDYLKEITPGHKRMACWCSDNFSTCLLHGGEQEHCLGMQTRSPNSSVYIHPASQMGRVQACIIHVGQVWLLRKEAIMLD